MLNHTWLYIAYYISDAYPKWPSNLDEKSHVGNDLPCIKMMKSDAAESSERNSKSEFARISRGTLQVNLAYVIRKQTDFALDLWFENLICNLKT